MSNIKSVTIKAQLDYNFIRMNESLAAKLADIIFTSEHKLEGPIPLGNYKNRNGGKTKVVTFNLWFFEAVFHAFLENLAKLFRSTMDTQNPWHKFKMVAIDVENGAKPIYY